MGWRKQEEGELKRIKKKERPGLDKEKRDDIMKETESGGEGVIDSAN